MGVAGLISALLVGRIPSPGRERTLILVGILASALAIALLPFAHALLLVALLIVLFGLANGPLDVGLITLRQRRTAPEWFGRAFAVSMSVNWLGSPLGSALAGLLIAVSLDLALYFAVTICLAAAVLALLTIPTQAALATNSHPLPPVGPKGA
jgi:predicted MFS family arabinose efflux permease